MPIRHSRENTMKVKAAVLCLCDLKHESQTRFMAETTEGLSVLFLTIQNQFNTFKSSQPTHII